MLKRHVLVAVTLSVGVVSSPWAVSAQTPGKVPTLTAQDREDIQKVVAGYARALGTCAAEDYANLFEPGTGFFESAFRGRVAGKEKLIALVKSEPQCGDGVKANLTPRPSQPTVIEVSELGVTGTLPNGPGRYEDVFVKTKDGWRFKSRNNVSKEATAFHFTFQDFGQIHDLAGDHGQFEDVYAQTPKGVVFRSGGMVIVPTSPQEAKARIHLKDDDGRYEDLYVRTPKGWRFASRTYVPIDDVAPSQGRR